MPSPIDAAGRIGLVVVGSLLLLAMYYAYLNVYVYGLESVLPAGLHNPPETKANRQRDRQRLSDTTRDTLSAAGEAERASTELMHSTQEYARRINRNALVAALAVVGVVVVLAGMYVFARRRRKPRPEGLPDA